MLRGVASHLMHNRQSLPDDPLKPPQTQRETKDRPCRVPKSRVGRKRQDRRAKRKFGRPFGGEQASVHGQPLNQDEMESLIGRSRFRCYAATSKTISRRSSDSLSQLLRYRKVSWQMANGNKWLEKIMLICGAALAESTCNLRIPHLQRGQAEAHGRRMHEHQRVGKESGRLEISDRLSRILALFAVSLSHFGVCILILGAV